MDARVDGGEGLKAMAGLARMGNGNNRKQLASSDEKKPPRNVFPLSKAAVVDGRERRDGFPLDN